MALEPLPTHVQDWPRYIRRILLRYVLPFVAAAAVLALVFAPYISRISVGEIAVPLLYDRLPALRTDPRRPEDWYGWVFRGLTSLPVTWEAG